uniref:Uncharacterized protein n=1 Tax=Panagrolaimus sp. PS1159 TaxID=55785 RepID=A0AC35F8T1_9BILA
MVPSSKKAADFLRSYNSRQNWSLSDSIIYYILMDPSTSKVYEKLIQSCKYFFIKNPILVVSCLSFDYKDGWRTTLVNLDNTSRKIWITNEISNLNKQKFFSSLIPKLYKSDAKEITLWSQNVYFHDLKSIASKCRRIWFNKVSVINENGTIIPLENILEILPYVKDFDYYIPDNSSHIITSKTVKELLRMPHFSVIRRFELSEIPEDFDIERFYGYIKNNNKTRIRLYFSQLIPNQYKNRLEAIIHEILETKTHDYKNNNKTRIFFN